MVARDSRRAGGSGSTPATRELDRRNISFRVHSFEVDSSDREVGYGMQAAQALGIPADQVFKTLVAMVDQSPCVALVPVSASLDLKALAEVVHGRRAQLADVAVAQRLTGYVIGGISPLGQRRVLRTVLDSSAELHSVIYVSAGRRGLDISLDPLDLVQLTSATLAPIARRDE